MIARTIKPTLNHLLDRQGPQGICQMRPDRKFVVHAGSEGFPLAKDIRAVTLPAIVQLLKQSR